MLISSSRYTGNAILSSKFLNFIQKMTISLMRAGITAQQPCPEVDWWSCSPPLLSIVLLVRGWGVFAGASHHPTMSTFWGGGTNTSARARTRTRTLRHRAKVYQHAALSLFNNQSRSIPCGYHDVCYIFDVDLYMRMSMPTNRKSTGTMNN